MKTELLMGNQLIALGAVEAGVNIVSGYPGTPSTEILETVSAFNDGSVYVEWSTNEKTALEVSAGASYAGARTMVTMKQVGLNVATDPLMSLAYVGVKGGMVVVSADDPGPISSQTEQDTRHFAQFAKLPVFDPSSPEEAYHMIKDAFEFSEKYSTPVLFRPTTRVCHSCTSIVRENVVKKNVPSGFVKDDSKWVIFPRTSYLNHIKIEKRNEELKNVFSDYARNYIEGKGKLGIATGGISYTYVQENLQNIDKNVKVFKVSTPFPFPEKLALQFLQGLDEVIVVEELDPVIEKELIFLCGKHNLNIKIKGKLSGEVAVAGENTVESVKAVLHNFLGIKQNKIEKIELPELPIRPPVLCAGCPHRASFYAVKKVAKGRKAVFSGDIGCYTLGNAKPLEMVDTCLCMGAGITIAQGLQRVEKDSVNFAFIGDSTFFASGISGVVNAVYNQTDIVVVVLDNSTTAMTGHQPHTGTGKTMMSVQGEKISIEKILLAIGVKKVVKANPLNLKQAKQAVSDVIDEKGVRAIIFESPCVAKFKNNSTYEVDENLCVGCSVCIKELGCPAISKVKTDKSVKVKIDEDLCYGCSICASVCPVCAIKEKAGGKCNAKR